jgi:hypothetical protein
MNYVNTPTCLESFKIPGRYHVKIMPCISTIMQGVDAVAPFSGGKFFNREASLFCDSLVFLFVGLLGSLCA